MMSDLTGAPVKTRPFPFMKLPIELRLEVYRELLRFEDEIRMKTKWSINCLHPNILQACYRIYDEVVEVLYRESTFYIYYDDPGNTNESRIKRARAHVFTDIYSMVSGPLKADKKI